MSQTSVIAASLLLAYVVFVIVRGELPCYFQVLGISTAASCPKGTVTTGGLNVSVGSGGVTIGTGTQGRTQ